MYLSYGKVALSKTERSDGAYLEGILPYGPFPRKRSYAVYSLILSTTKKWQMYGCAAWTATLAQ